ncbi:MULTISPECIES: UbiX family flavin prenyltransferase [Acidithiobacillus]|jgi:4-hydroxy-3-polyprenylbenzoate decarboxylase|uniref:Flavin prenyltransferase UbiX n=3 Tax=Acidithiobacillus caldus TaxID=33059 RepID=F9ZR19_ACICS|nr:MULTISPECIES: flavin prenyltransferase UbiX [Acidithiobacillus]AEK58323.1 3-polyprenyl-4-hydroxybenzoate carboxy-lyase UbiX [Acidithiobacillus caldus SM-1]AIA55292.1 3-polyprenyl-4-hydroxybenzoate carboxy-lyase UbiX [Acidithiobacillus caldus ATCC 51756]AUW32928.1 UbiX family flavin prenyltransferase [Acidithiobacillus caldus]MBU2728520.1 UbiX family flavin prenyltransferase [Acidithiobacillus caldus]MBU2736186.1 UbiX family flavin prenyltransferase [Acidithiobacillus caldus ATCC 51756]
MARRIGVAITGASGAPYAQRLLQRLLAADCDVAVVFSAAARIVWREELGQELPTPMEALTESLRAGLPRTGTLRCYDERDWFSPLASGSHAPEALVICPCSGGTLAAVAQGLSNNLAERAADVMLKEGRKLILVPRESPISAIHLENMLKLARLGVTILPASPGFYTRPQSIDELLDFVVARILDQLDLGRDFGPQWGL